MSSEERKSLEEERFEVEELDDQQLEDVSGGEGVTNTTRCLSGNNASACG